MLPSHPHLRNLRLLIDLVRTHSTLHSMPTHDVRVVLMNDDHQPARLQTKRYRKEKFVLDSESRQLIRQYD